MALFLSELVDVLLDTETFFDQRHGQGIGRTVAYFAFISFVSLLINWILLFYGITPAGLIPFEKILNGGEIAFLIPFLYFVAGFFFVFLYTFVTASILRKKGSPTPFKRVLIVASYGFTPSLLTLWIPVLGLFLLIWSLYLTAMGLGVYNGAGLKRNFLACVGGGVVMAAVLLLFLLGIGAAFISLYGKDLALLWTVLIPV